MNQNLGASPTFSRSGLLNNPGVGLSQRIFQSRAGNDGDRDNLVFHDRAPLVPSDSRETTVSRVLIGLQDQSPLLSEELRGAEVERAPAVLPWSIAPAVERWI
jgi:hypothetical protein